jgi:hypothetical protein
MSPVAQQRGHIVGIDGEVGATALEVTHDVSQMGVARELRVEPLEVEPILSASLRSSAGASGRSLR